MNAFLKGLEKGLSKGWNTVKKYENLATSILPAAHDTFTNVFSGRFSKVLPDIAKDFKQGWQKGFGHKGNVNLQIGDSQNAQRANKENEIAKRDAERSRTAFDQQTRQQFQNPSLGEG